MAGPSKRVRVGELDEDGLEDAGLRLAFPAPVVSTLSIHHPEDSAARGTQDKIPVHRIYCVGRNYWDHSIEMGADPEREPPFFFMKPADSVVDTSVKDEVAYPASTSCLHYETELVLVINTPDGLPVGNLNPKNARDYVYGYAVGIDLTRRDLQKQAKELRRCWSASKGFDQSAPIGPVTLSSDLSEICGATIGNNHR